jgi:uncharacterized membrane protein YdjX (TVP38/TMEM64 family)
MDASDAHVFSFRRLIPLGLLALAGAVFIASGGRRYLTFAVLSENREYLRAIVTNRPALTALGYIGLYAGLTTLSVPGAMLLTLAAGFLFGPWLGTLYALVGATIGATAVFLAARSGLAGFAARAGPRAERLEAGFRKDAFNYLLCLRLVPIFPFWLVNLIAGIFGMRLTSYVAATFLGMVPGALVYAGLGSGLGTVMEHPHFHIWSEPHVLLPLLGLALLALVPVIYKRWRARRRHEPAE